MNSAPLSSANDVRDAAYHRNQVKSLCFLALLAVVLVAAALLSLRAGSYNTPLAELVRGVFGLAQDEKINLVVQANRLPRICTAILGGAGLGLAGCILQAILNNPLASASTLGVSQGPPSARPSPSWCWALRAKAAWASPCAPSPVRWRWRRSSWGFPAFGRSAPRASCWRAWPSVPCSPAPPPSSSILPAKWNWPPWCSGPSATWAAPT